MSRKKKIMGKKTIETPSASLPSFPLIKTVRITPTIQNQWAGIVSEVGGITCSQGLTLVADSYIKWPAGITFEQFDSTVLATYNEYTELLNYSITAQDAEEDFGGCGSGTNGISSVQVLCLKTDQCIPYLDPNPTPSCLDTKDGLIQFIAQLCAQPSIQFNSIGLNLVLQPPYFPYSDPTTGAEISCFSAPTEFICPLGNWSPIHFPLGNCNKCSHIVSLLHIGCPTDDEPVEESITSATAGNCGTEEATEHLTTQLSTYNVAYANVQFYLAKKGVLAKFTKATSLVIAPATENPDYDAFFAQTRPCGSVNLILRSCVIDLNCLYYGTTPVYVIISTRIISLPL